MKRLKGKTHGHEGGHRDVVHFPYNPGPATTKHPHRPPGGRVGRTAKFDYETRLNRHHEWRRVILRNQKAARRRSRGVVGYTRIGSQRRA